MTTARLSWCSCFLFLLHSRIKVVVKKTLTTVVMMMMVMMKIKIIMLEVKLIKLSTTMSEATTIMTITPHLNLQTRARILKRDKND